MSSLYEVYITNTSTFFPNEPVSNAEMEQILGFAGGKPSKSRPIILRSNGIKNRYYALKKDGSFNYSNASLVSNAVEKLFDNDFQKEELELLACGTSSPDMLLPGLASMVHGELKCPNVELISSAGACCSGIQAMKFAWLAIRTGEASNGVCSGSERVSQYLMGNKFEAEMQNLQTLEENPILGFEKDFLRWMLSDGAGAFLLQNKPVENGLNLKIEWIEITSFANELETCMYLGADKNGSNTLHSFGEMSTDDWARRSVFAYKQDVRLLGENIVQKGALWLKKVMNKRHITGNDIDLFLPHLSSMFFWRKIVDEFANQDIDIPEAKWFINLPHVGNIGAASAYAMVDELYRSGKLVKGQKIMLFVPESARFSYSIVYLTVC